VMDSNTCDGEELFYFKTS